MNLLSHGLNSASSLPPTGLPVTSQTVTFRIFTSSEVTANAAGRPSVSRKCSITARSPSTGAMLTSKRLSGRSVRKVPQEGASFSSRLAGLKYPGQERNPVFPCKARGKSGCRVRRRSDEITPLQTSGLVCVKIGRPIVIHRPGIHIGGLGHGSGPDSVRY